MEALADRRRRLYGLDRSLARQDIVQTLTKSHVLQDGEYNYTNETLKDGIWQTSAKRDFPGTELDRDHVAAGVGQLDHHFHLGNDSGSNLPTKTYQGSTTKDDFDTKSFSKPAVLAADRTINWPDMAPRYAPHRAIGQSEYKNTFMLAGRAATAPVFPKVNTCKMKLPLDPAKFHLQRDSHFDFGHDESSGVSEHMRTYGRSRQDDLSSKLASTGDALKIKRHMKEMELTSNVFRGGDYNGVAAHNYETTTFGDYGPRTRPPAEIIALQFNQDKPRDGRASENVPNELTTYARQHTVPAVFKDALDGRDYQRAAHFKLGSDANTVASIYGKDFAPGGMVTWSKPKFYEPPSAGNLLQNDPDFSKFGTTSNQTDFTFSTMPMAKGADGRTIMEGNIDRRHGNNVILSYDPSRHADDRQKSLSHGDYLNPPSAYTPMQPVKAPTVEFDYLRTNDALPYEGLPNLSEAKNTFAGTFMGGIHAMDRRRQKEEHCRDRNQMRKETHFTLGYSGPDFITETNNQFDGRPQTDQEKHPAGKTEFIPDTKFGHLNASENTQDMKAADPYVSSSKEALTIRNLFEPAKTEAAFNTSVMKSDYTPLGRRRMNAHQHRMLDKYDTLSRKTIEDSHFFHTDNTGRNNYLSTTINDFIKPEVMTGQKLLAAR
ncbi:uncharacterized protein LOC124146663 isoform X1 [Haliotis rufescens]|uniref:uncharacterized protein LOC124146663 isoform X1 n=2 Tax=Haliotis rufescens TaxID=6454 RepID=UPI00201F7A4A|nr:uncharacterized protein LOC124146663 isoform X1 [Haliotis rufescens]